VIILYLFISFMTFRFMCNIVVINIMQKNVSNFKSRSFIKVGLHILQNKDFQI